MPASRQSSASGPSRVHPPLEQREMEAGCTSCCVYAAGLSRVHGERPTTTTQLNSTALDMVTRLFDARLALLRRLPCHRHALWRVEVCCCLEALDVAHQPCG
jgi:hypothetical protein